MRHSAHARENPNSGKNHPDISRPWLKVNEYDSCVFWSGALHWQKPGSHLHVIITIIAIITILLFFLLFDWEGATVAIKMTEIIIDENVVQCLDTSYVRLFLSKGCI